MFYGIGPRPRSSSTSMSGASRMSRPKWSVRDILRNDLQEMLKNGETLHRDPT